MSKIDSSKVRKKSFGTTMGVTSIIAILVILVLVVFSTLSLITAKADLNLSEKASANVSDYYKVDGEAETILAETSDVIAKNGNINRYAKNNKYEYKKNGNDHLIKFILPIDASRQLNVEALFDSEGKVKERQLWQVSPSNEWQADTEIQLIK